MSNLTFDYPVSLDRLWPTPVQGTIIDRIEWEGVPIAHFHDERTDQDSWRVVCPVNPIRCTSVTMTRMEGPMHLCDRPKVCEGHELEWKGKTRWTSAIQVASTEFVLWGDDCSTGSYDKCKTTTFWDSLGSFSFRFDLQWGGTCDGMSFRDLLNKKIFYWAGLYKPSHMSVNKYQREIEKAEALGFPSLCRSILTLGEL